MATVYLARDLKHHRRAERLPRGGLHDELLTQLSKVASLKVISRTSVMGYQGTTKPLRQIADELGVGTMAAEARAQTLAQAGHADGALDEIERLLAGPSWLSVHSLRLDPRWDPIRNHPRFQALLKKYGSCRTAAAMTGSSQFGLTCRAPYSGPASVSSAIRNVPLSAEARSSRAWSASASATSTSTLPSPSRVRP